MSQPLISKPLAIGSEITPAELGLSEPEEMHWLSGAQNDTSSEPETLTLSCISFTKTEDSTDCIQSMEYFGYESVDGGDSGRSTMEDSEDSSSTFLFQSGKFASLHTSPAPVFLITRPGEEPRRESPRSETTNSAQQGKIKRRRLDGCPLKKFQNGGMKHEFYVIKILRKFVTAVTTVCNGKVPKPTGLLEVTKNNSEAEAKLQVFIEMVKREKECLNEFVNAKYLPKSDRQSKRDGDAQYCSFNKTFLSYYLNLSPYLRIAFFFFCEVVFSARSNDLCEVWNMQCCEGGHGQSCQELWQQLREYTENAMLVEVEVEPYIPDGN